MKSQLPKILRRLAEIAEENGGEIPDIFLNLGKPPPPAKTNSTITKNLVKKHLYGKINSRIR